MDRAASLAGAGGRGGERGDGIGGLEEGVESGERERMGIVHFGGGWVDVDGCSKRRVREAWEDE